MSALVKVVSPGDYQAWLQQQQTGIDAANQQVIQLRQLLQQTGNL
jgi:heme/copper-type cytochrome/quinol oxidase subunit 2